MQNEKATVDKLSSIREEIEAVHRQIQDAQQKYDLNKARERAHILEGLLKALDNIDEVIRIIRASQNVQIAKQELMERFEADGCSGSGNRRCSC